MLLFKPQINQIKQIFIHKGLHRFDGLALLVFTTNCTNCTNWRNPFNPFNPLFLPSYFV